MMNSPNKFRTSGGVKKLPRRIITSTIYSPLPTPNAQLPPEKAKAQREPKATSLSGFLNKAYGKPRWTEMVRPQVAFNINRLKSLVHLDPVTKLWIRNATDERAAQEGMKFNQRRAMFTVDWIEEYCYLYEGDKGGTLMLLEDWQYEFIMRLFGWVYWNEERSCWLRRYKQATAWIAKKNAKSPTLAAIGLYMLCGEGEPGQKCYSLARDFNQAMISHRHAIEMVKASEPLSACCTINKSHGTITHEPTASRYIPVSGDNTKSTEGFNGSIFIDEIHVVTQDLVSRTKRATISRKEPLHVEVSTAGNNMDGYGYERYIYGKRCLAYTGQPEDVYAPHYLVLDYSAPQDTTVEVLSKRDEVERLATLANPTLGRILYRSELMSDWQESKTTNNNLLEFGMYRLNIWLNALATWLAPGEWASCKSPTPYTLDFLKQYPCVAGIDLSQARDMTALVMMWSIPNENGGVIPYVIPHFWIPEKTAIKFRNHIDFSKFGDSLNIVPNSKTIPYELLATTLSYYHKNHDLLNIGIDPYNAKKFVKLCNTDEYDVPEDLFTEVSQTMLTIGPYTKIIEHLIISKNLLHDGNSVLSWQVSNVQIYTDNNKNKRPVKTNKDDYRTIDGVMAMIDALAVFHETPACMADNLYESILLFDKDYLEKLKNAQIETLSKKRKPQRNYDYYEET